MVQAVSSVEEDGLAASAEIGADSHGGVAVEGVGVNEELAVADVVMDLLRLVGDLADLAAGTPRHWTVRPGLIPRPLPPGAEGLSLP